jgi:hypothetical protein
VFALFSRRLRRWLLLSVGLPAALWGMAKLGSSLEERRGPSVTTRALKTPHRWLRRREQAAHAT